MTLLLLVRNDQTDLASTCLRGFAQNIGSEDPANTIILCDDSIVEMGEMLYNSASNRFAGFPSVSASACVSSAQIVFRDT